MDPKSTVIMDGAIWIADAAIAAITKRGDPVPEGFAGVVPLETGGTVFPGLIELHNHLAYNALPLWNVPQKYTNRDQWGNTPISPARHRADEDDRRGDRTASGARPLRRVQGARRRRDDHAGHRAVQRARRPALLQGNRPQRRGDRGQAAARGRQPHRRRRREGPAGVPGRDREEDVLPPAPQRGHRRRRPQALRGAPALREASGRSRRRSPASTASR